MTIDEKILHILREKNGWSTAFIEEVVNSSVDDLHDPFLLENMNEFIKVLDTYKNKRIMIVPDYDADGILSGTLLYAGLDVLGFEDVLLYPPRTHTGYGLTERSAKEVLDIADDVDVILTSDNGSNAHSGVDYLLDHNVDVLITDHHKATNGDPVPNVINPNRETDTYPNKGLSGTAVAWKMLQAYASTYANEQQQHLIDLLIVFVGMSVISDVMPLLDENRYVVKETIRILSDVEFLGHGANVGGVYGDAFEGLLSLYKVADSHGKFNYGFDESALGFVFGPMLNSPRRMSGRSLDGFNVFIRTGQQSAMDSAQNLYKINEKRKRLLREYRHEYLTPVMISDTPGEYMIGVAPHRSGLIGLLAGGYTQQFQLPAIVFSDSSLKETHYNGEFENCTDEDKIFGSGRSPEWFDLHGALTSIYEESPEWFVSFGGHKLAVGIGIYKKYYEAFRQRFISKVFVELERVQDMLAEDTTEVVDDIVWLGYREDQSADVCLPHAWDVMDLIQVIDYIDTLKPFGHAFSEPAFGVNFSTKDVEVFFMGKDKQHVKFTLPNGLVVIYWNGADRLELEFGHLSGPFEIQVSGTLSVNTFMDKQTVQLIADVVNVV